MSEMCISKPKDVKQTNFKYYAKDWKPFLSVIIFVDEKIDLLDKTLISLYNQTYYLFEIILVVSGKKIVKEDYVKGLFLEPGRIRIVQQKVLKDKQTFLKKEGKKLTSSYVVFLKAGDLLDATYLETSYISLQVQNRDWSYTDSVKYGSMEQKFKKAFDWKEFLLYNDELWGCMVKKNLLLEWVQDSANSLCSFLYKKKSYPIHISYYGYWFYQKQANIKREEEMDDISTDKSLLIEFPRNQYQGEILKEVYQNLEFAIRKKDEKIHILMIVPWMEMGGADKFNLDLLTRIDKNKFAITLITTHPIGYIWRPFFEKTDIEIFDLSTFLDHKYWNSFLNYIMETRHIQLIFNTNSTFGYVSVPYIKEKYPHIPIIDYIHTEEWYNRYGGYSRDNHIVHTLLDKTLFCNQRSEGILHDFFKVPKEQIDTVYIGVDADLYNPNLYDKQSIMDICQVPYNRFIIGYICRISTEKRPFLLLEIVSKIKNEIPNVLFLVAGDGPLLEEMKKQVLEKELSSYIQFLGKIENEKTCAFYKMCDMTINCSIKEGLALTTYESLSMGVPVISSDVGGQGELIDESVGIIVPLLQEEEKLYESSFDKEEVLLYVHGILRIKKNLSSYKKHAREKILHAFTLEKMVMKMEEIFTKTVLSPRKEAIHNAEALRYNANIFKEYIHYYFMTDLPHFQFLCNAYYKEFYEPPAISLSEEELEAMQKNKIVFQMEQRAIRAHCYHEFIVLENMAISLIEFIKCIFLSIWKVFSGIFILLYQLCFNSVKFLFLLIRRVFLLCKKIVKREKTG